MQDLKRSNGEAHEISLNGLIDKHIEHGRKTKKRRDRFGEGYTKLKDRFDETVLNKLAVDVTQAGANLTLCQ